MAWLRVDDGYDSHPKILALGSDQRRWTWTRILVYTCRYRSPVIPPNVSELVPRATPAFLRECVDIGLVDVTDDGTLEVHDWILYNADTVEAKVIWYLERNPDATANDVQREVGGKRELVLAAVHAYRGNHTGNHSTGSREPVSVPVSGSLSGSRARAPVPSPTQLPTAATTSTRDAPDPPAADAVEQLRQAGWNERQLIDAADEPRRALALLHAAQADPTCERPGALAWIKFQAGETPDQQQRSTIAPGATGTRSSSPPMPDKEPEPQPERTPPPPEFLALAGGTT